MQARLFAFASLFSFFVLFFARSASAIPVPPCNLAAHDASAGMLGALRLAEHVAQRESGMPNGDPKKLAREVIVSELGLAHTLALQAMSDRKAAQDDTSVSALAAIDQILIGLSNDLTSTTAKKDPFHGVVGRIAQLGTKTKLTIGGYEKNLDLKLLAILIGLSLKHGIVPGTDEAPSEQIVSFQWLLGNGGVADKLAKGAAKLAVAHSAAQKLASARAALIAGTSTLESFESAHAALVGILIGL